MICVQARKCAKTGYKQPGQKHAEMLSSYNTADQDSDGGFDIGQICRHIVDLDASGQFAKILRHRLCCKQNVEVARLLCCRRSCSLNSILH